MTYVENREDDYDKVRRQYTLFVRDRRRARAATLSAMWREWAITKNGIDGEVPPLFRLLEHPSGTGMCSVVQTRDGLSVLFEWAFNGRSNLTPFTIVREGISPHHEDDIVDEISYALTHAKKRTDTSIYSNRKSSKKNLIASSSSTEDAGWGGTVTGRWTRDRPTYVTHQANTPAYPTPAYPTPTYHAPVDPTTLGTPVRHEPTVLDQEPWYYPHRPEPIEPQPLRTEAEYATEASLNTLRQTIGRLQDELRNVDVEDNQNER